MTRQLLSFTLPAMYALLPTVMRSASASAMLLAIALQETRLLHRRQLGGPARGFWQFERGGGVQGVLMHPASRPHIESILAALRYDPIPIDCYTAIEHNDVLAASFARLLLWTLPDPLPLRGNADRAWTQYLAAWRPGKPHRETWDDFYAQAWALVDAYAVELGLPVRSAEPLRIP